MMKKTALFLIAALVYLCSSAAKYEYKFRNTPISQALAQLGTEHPELKISFLYHELDKYKTSATISTDNDYDAVRQIVSLNPIYVTVKGTGIYVEAMQRGIFSYSGRVVGNDGEPVAAASVLILEPSDSTVITYGFTDDAGKFTIPCDKQGVIAKLSCLGYFPTYHTCNNFAIGTINMQQRPTKLGDVTVEADDAYLYSDRSVYIPTSRQKNSAQTGTELIMRMAIPQLSIGPKLQTNTGKEVTLYIDYTPASDSELNGMRIADVKKVEYYDFPSDPRFQGNEHVINFIMQQYEYGGYTKASYSDNFTMSRLLNTYTKLQYKKMTYDLGVGGLNVGDKDRYTETDEIYRLPQEDGSIKEFHRYSEVSDFRKNTNMLWLSLKAHYKSDNASISNRFRTGINHTPTNRSAGTVTYSPAEFKTSEYEYNGSSRVNSFGYDGYWQFTISPEDRLILDPHYAYSHTNQFSTYSEKTQALIQNGAKDDSHQATIEPAYQHTFPNGNKLGFFCPTMFLQNKTYYSGSSTLSDISRNYRLSSSIKYGFTNDKISLSLSGGLQWDKSSYCGEYESSTSPSAETSVQYTVNRKNSFYFSGIYKKSIPASGYRSASIVQDNPLLAYTGNPNVKPYNYYLLDGSYTYIPNKKWNFSVFGSTWIVNNRYVYDYVANSKGVLRRIKQPGGSYAQWEYGISGTTRQLDGKLQLSARFNVYQAHNGDPYNWTKTDIGIILNAWYYLNDFYFGGMFYESPAYADGCMVGDWLREKSLYSLTIGWSHKNFNCRLFAQNFFNYKSQNGTKKMNSQYYDKTSYLFKGRELAHISVTYTFAFGKKIERGNEASYQGADVTSGILK